MEENKEKPSYRRNRTETTQRILKALEEVLTESGIGGVGINRVADRAGVSKVLVYRYFGGIEGLLARYIETAGFFPPETEAKVEPMRPTTVQEKAWVCSRQVALMYRQLRMSAPGQELIRATLLGDEPLAAVSSRTQDELLTKMVEQLPFERRIDLQAISAVVLGGMSYLLLLSRNQRSMLGIDPGTEQGWARIEEALKTIYNGVYRVPISRKQSQSIFIDS